MRIAGRDGRRDLIVCWHGGWPCLQYGGRNLTDKVLSIFPKSIVGRNEPRSDVAKDAKDNCSSTGLQDFGAPSRRFVDWKGRDVGALQGVQQSSVAEFVRRPKAAAGHAVEGNRRGQRAGARNALGSSRGEIEVEHFK